MYLLTSRVRSVGDAIDAKKALAKLSSSLPSGLQRPIHVYRGPRFEVTWSAVRPSDNLHVFTDGLTIGKLDFAEPADPDPIYHGSPVPDSFHPLINSVAVRRHGNSWYVEPNGTTNVYYDGDTISDRQLLIAEIKGYKPGFFSRPRISRQSVTWSATTLCLKRSSAYRSCLVSTWSRLRSMRSDATRITRRMTLLWSIGL